MKSIIFPSALILFVLSLVPLYAQSEAVISYAEGESFQLVRDGESSSFRIETDNVIGMPIFTEDTILTDRGSFVEILLESGNGAVIKIAENTTFSVAAMDGRGGGVFQVSFGRIRVKAAALFDGSRFWVTGHDTVAGVRGTDFGYDIFYDLQVDGAERQTTVYCFDGEVEVLQYDKEEVSKIDLMDMDPKIVSPGKMVVASSDQPDRNLKLKTISDEILTYWNMHPIITAIDGSPVISEDLNLKPSPYSDKYTYETGGKITFAMGVGIMTIGGLLKAFLPKNDMAGDLTTGLLAIGGASVVAGGGMMLYSLSLP